jgi:hypothetical protein
VTHYRTLEIKLDMINVHAYCTICKSDIPLFNINAENEIRINSSVACCGIEVILTGRRKQIEISKPTVENIAIVEAKKTINSEYSEYLKTVPNGKILSSKKVYKVSVNYIQLKDEEAKIKRNIVQSILNKSQFF